jgi:hypothetical protein
MGGNLDSQIKRSKEKLPRSIKSLDNKAEPHNLWNRVERISVRGGGYIYYACTCRLRSRYAQPVAGSPVTSPTVNVQQFPNVFHDGCLSIFVGIHKCNDIFTGDVNQWIYPVTFISDTSPTNILGWRFRTWIWQVNPTDEYMGPRRRPAADAWPLIFVGNLMNIAL